MRPQNNRKSFSSRVPLLAAGLGLGAVLGWTLWPGPPAAPSGPIADSAPAASGAKVAKDQKPSALPYDTETLLAGGFGRLADFEMWLRTASCEDTARLILGLVDRRALWNAPVPELLVRRFREFSVDDRFAVLEKLNADTKTVGTSDCQRIFGDLAEDALPRRAGDFLALIKMFPSLDPWHLAPGFKTWAAADLPAVMGYLEKIEGSRRNQQLTSRVLEEVAETNPALAREQALKLPQGPARDQAMGGVARVMAKTSLGEALDWLSAHQFGGTGNYETLSVLRSVISRAASTNPSAAARLLLDRPELFENHRGPEQVKVLFETWARKDPSGATSWVETHPLPAVYQEMAEAVMAPERLRSQPLDQALASLSSLSKDALRGGVDALALRLRQEDPGHVMERLAAALPEKGRAEALAAVIGKLSSWEFDQAMPFLAEIGSILEKNPYLSARFSELPEEQLISLIRQLPEKAADAVRGEMLDWSLGSDPGRALRLAESAGTEKLSPFNASRVALLMAEEDPAKASAWVAGFAEGPNKEWAALNLVSNWAKYDPAAAADWVQTLPPGTARDRAALEAVKIQGRTGNAESALTLAAGLADPKARAEATGYALQSLWHRNPAQAATALAATGLSANEQATLTEKLAQGGFAQ